MLRRLGKRSPSVDCSSFVHLEELIVLEFMYCQLSLKSSDFNFESSSDAFRSGEFFGEVMYVTLIPFKESPLKQKIPYNVELWCSTY